MSARQKRQTAKSTDAPNEAFFDSIEGLTDMIDNAILPTLTSMLAAFKPEYADDAAARAEWTRDSYLDMLARFLPEYSLHALAQRHGASELQRELGGKYDQRKAAATFRTMLEPLYAERDIAKEVDELVRVTNEESPDRHEADTMTQYIVTITTAAAMQARHFIREYLKEEPHLADSTLLAGLKASVTAIAPASFAAASVALSLPADRISGGLVRYIGGREKPVGRTPEGFDRLASVKRQGYELQHLEVRYDPTTVYATHPDDVKPVLDRIKAEKNETKAKTLLAAFAYASDPNTADVGDFTVDLEDLVELVSGYKRTGPKKTNRRYYHRKVAEIVRYLHVDLAFLQVNIRVVRRKKGKPDVGLVRGEYLMKRPRLVSDQEVVYEEFYDELRRLIVASASLDRADLTAEERTKAEASRDAVVAYLEHVKPTLVGLGFPKNVADALALGGNQARERVSSGVLKSLKGPAFWLAYDLAFRRRWTRHKSLKTGDGTPLLDVLTDAGFVEASAKRSGDRPSYKVALRDFFDAVDELLDLGELDHPGVEILKPHNGPGRPRNVTQAVRKWTTTRGKHVREEDLKPLTLRYVMVEERVAALQASREKAKPKRRKRSAAG